MIRLRDDDVLLRSKGWEDPVSRFRTIHTWAKSCGMLHVPAIVTKELGCFNEAIHYVIEQTRNGTMEPQLHGVEHIDYAKLSPKDLDDHLAHGVTWMTTVLGVRPSIWYTPWGANSPDIRAAAAVHRLKLVDTSAILTIERVHRELREGTMQVADLDGRELFMHWWSRGLRLKRIAAAINAGGWTAAAEREPALFGE